MHRYETLYERAMARTMRQAQRATYGRLLGHMSSLGAMAVYIMAVAEGLALKVKLKTVETYTLIAADKCADALMSGVMRDHWSESHRQSRHQRSGRNVSAKFMDVVLLATHTCTPY